MISISVNSKDQKEEHTYTNSQDIEYNLDDVAKLKFEMVICVGGSDKITICNDVLGMTTSYIKQERYGLLSLNTVSEPVYRVNITRTISNVLHIKIWANEGHCTITSLYIDCMNSDAEDTTA